MREIEHIAWESETTTGRRFRIVRLPAGGPHRAAIQVESGRGEWVLPSTVGPDVVLEALQALTLAILQASEIGFISGLAPVLFVAGGKEGEA